MRHAQNAINIIASINENKGANDRSELDNAGPTLAIAFYNAGVEMEHLYRRKEAYDFCSKGLITCTQILGEDHFLCKNLKELVSTLAKYKDEKEPINRSLRSAHLILSTKNATKSISRTLSKSPYDCYKNGSKTSMRTNSVLRGSSKNTINASNKPLLLPTIKVSTNKSKEYKNYCTRKKSDYSSIKNELRSVFNRKSEEEQMKDPFKTIEIYNKPLPLKKEKASPGDIFIATIGILGKYFNYH